MFSVLVPMDDIDAELGNCTIDRLNRAALAIRNQQVGFCKNSFQVHTGGSKASFTSALSQSVRLVLLRMVILVAVV